MLAKKLLFSAVFALAIGVTAGCQSSPSHADLAEVRAMAEEALHAAKAAAQDAAAAKECCHANTERMDRMFHDSMKKGK